MKQLADFVALRPRFFVFACLAALITLAVTVLTYAQTGAILLALAWGAGTGMGALGCVLAVRISILIRPVVRESDEVRQESERLRERYALLERRVGRLSVRYEDDAERDAQ